MARPPHVAARRPFGGPSHPSAPPVLNTATLVYRAGARLARVLPKSLALRTADALGAGAGLMAGDRREQVERNLQRVHGAAADDASRRREVRRTFQSYARYWVESFRLPDISPAELDAGIRVDGWNHIEDGLAGGKGVILALPHLGGWEWAGFWATACKHVPVTVVVEPLEPRDLFEWFADFRRALGMNVVALGPDAGTKVVNALKSNHVLCLLCDRDLGGDGVEVTFFGERTTLPAGPAALALRTGAPLLPAAVYFEPPGHRALLRPPLDTARRAGFRADVARITQSVADELEALIRRAPDQWHLLQPNWPSDRQKGS